MIILVGFFTKTPEEIAFKKNIEQFKKFKKLVKGKKYPEALKLGLDYLEKVYDTLMNEQTVITVPKKIADKARLAIDRMLEIS